MDQVFADPQVKHMQVRAEVTHPRLGKLGLINQPVKLSRTPAKLAAASPERGEHTQEVLLEIGFSKTEVDSFKSKGIV
jgi:formyl-CoA transferase